MNPNIRIHDDGGRARLVLQDGDRPVGVATVTWHDYALMCRKLATIVLEESRRVVAENLAKMVWRDAQAHSDLSPELAMKRLAELGWTQKQIERYADELSLLLTNKLLERLPEHL